MTNSDQTSQQPTPEEKKIIRGKLPFVCCGKVAFVEIVTDDEDAAMAIGAMFADTFIVAFLQNGGLINNTFIESASQALGREFTLLDEGYVSHLAQSAKIGKMAEPFVHTLREVADGSIPNLNLLWYLR